MRKTKLTLILLFALLFFSGCSVFDRPHKDSDGYYTGHYNCCGPIALEVAINKYYHNLGIKFKRNPAPRKEISRSMQDDGFLCRGILSLLDKKAVCITWPSEIKKICREYGFEPISLKDFAKLDPKKDVAVVLVHRKFELDSYHWIVFPVQKMKFYGSKTVIVKIYLLKRIVK